MKPEDRARLEIHRKQERDAIDAAELKYFDEKKRKAEAGDFSAIAKFLLIILFLPVILAGVGLIALFFVVKFAFQLFSKWKHGK